MRHIIIYIQSMYVQTYVAACFLFVYFVSVCVFLIYCFDCVGLEWVSDSITVFTNSLLQTIGESLITVTSSTCIWVVCIAEPLADTNPADTPSHPSLYLLLPSLAHKQEEKVLAHDWQNPFCSSGRGDPGIFHKRCVRLPLLFSTVLIISKCIHSFHSSHLPCWKQKAILDFASPLPSPILPSKYSSEKYANTMGTAELTISQELTAP